MDMNKTDVSSYQCTLTVAFVALNYKYQIQSTSDCSDGGYGDK